VPRIVRLAEQRDTIHVALSHAFGRVSKVTTPKPTPTGSAEASSFVACAVRAAVVGTVRHFARLAEVARIAAALVADTNTMLLALVWTAQKNIARLAAVFGEAFACEAVACAVA